MKKLLIKVVATMVAIVMVCGLLSGCGGEKLAKNDGKVQISISFWEASTGKAVEKSFQEITKNYQKLHPEVSFKLMSQPNSGYQDWLKARFAADDAPTIIMNNAANLMEQYANGYIHNFAEEFDKPSEYADGQIWRDTFIEGKLDIVHDFRMEPCCAVPFGGRGVGIFYNKAIYKECQLEVPVTWNEFMANCEKIAQKGYNPIAMMAMKPDAVGWFNWYVLTGLYANYYLGDERINPNKDNILHNNEFVNAVKKGYIDFTKGFDNEVINKYLDMAEQWGKYSIGAVGLDEAGAKAQVLAGTAAHIMTGSWDMPLFLENKSIDMGVMDLPAFDVDETEYVGSNMKFSSVTAFGITKSEKRTEAEYKAALDFLKFMTSPDQYKIYTENSMTVPDIKGLEVDEVFKTINQGEAESLNIIRNTTTSEVTKTTILTTAMSGKPYNRDELIKGIQKSTIEYCDEFIKKNSLSADDDYGIANVPLKAPFVPTKSKAAK